MNPGLSNERIDPDLDENRSLTVRDRLLFNKSRQTVAGRLPSSLKHAPKDNRGVTRWATTGSRGPAGASR